MKRRPKKTSSPSIEEDVKTPPSELIRKLTGRVTFSEEEGLSEEVFGDQRKITLGEKKTDDDGDDNDEDKDRSEESEVGDLAEAASTTSEGGCSLDELLFPQSDEDVDEEKWDFYEIVGNELKERRVVESEIGENIRRERFGHMQNLKHEQETVRALMASIKQRVDAAVIELEQIVEFKEKQHKKFMGVFHKTLENELEQCILKGWCKKGGMEFIDMTAELSAFGAAFNPVMYMESGSSASQDGEVRQLLSPANVPKSFIDYSHFSQSEWVSLSLLAGRSREMCSKLVPVCGQPKLGIMKELMRPQKRLNLQSPPSAFVRVYAEENIAESVKTKTQLYEILSQAAGCEMSTRGNTNGGPAEGGAVGISEAEKEEMSNNKGNDTGADTGAVSCLSIFHCCQEDSHLPLDSLKRSQIRKERMLRKGILPGGLSATFLEPPPEPFVPFTLRLDSLQAEESSSEEMEDDNWDAEFWGDQNGSQDDADGDGKVAVQFGKVYATVADVGMQPDVNGEKKGQKLTEYWQLEGSTTDPSWIYRGREVRHGDAF